MSSSYSSSPLSQELGIKEGYNIIVVRPPQEYGNMVTNLPEEVTQTTLNGSTQADFIHAFCTHQKDLIQDIEAIQSSLKKNGMLWISWPKEGSKIATDLNRDWIREYILKVGLVDVKFASIDEDWSALKFMYRIKDRL